MPLYGLNAFYLRRTINSKRRVKKGEDLRVEGIVGFSQKAVVILGISGDQKVLCRMGIASRHFHFRFVPKLHGGHMGFYSMCLMVIGRFFVTCTGGFKMKSGYAVQCSLDCLALLLLA